MHKPSVVFFGSGPVAAQSLELLAKNFEIEAVITKPRPPHHKGSVPVLGLAEKFSLPVLTAKNKKELDELFKKQMFHSPVGVLIDFGIIVSQEVIDYFPKGIVNSHFSVLPEWRGADPITFAILSGQKDTGVSLMLLVEKMDEGPLLAYGVYELPPQITIGQLTEHLIRFSDALLTKELPRYLVDGKTAPQTVTGRKTSYSRKLSKEDGRIDWTKPAATIEREIRAFLGWPGSYTALAGKDLIITQAHVIATTGAAGTATIQDKQLVVYCGKDALVIDTLKPVGKAEMSGQAFIAGHKNLL